MIIICESYPHIQYALGLLDQNKEHSLVLVFNPQILKVFQAVKKETELDFNVELAQEPEFYLTVHPLNMAVNTLKYIRSKVSSKPYPNLRKYNSQSVYFFSRWTSSHQLAILIKTLAPRNKVIYAEDYIYKVLPIKVLKGGDVNGMTTGQHPSGLVIQGLSDNFLRKYVSDYQPSDLFRGGLLTNNTTSYAQHNYKCIFIGENLIEGNCVEPELYKQEMKPIVEVMKQVIPDSKLAAKSHPDTRPENQVIAAQELLPKYIPIELFYNSKVETYISIASLALTRVPGGKAISLLDLITFKDQALKDVCRRMFVEHSQTKVLFPKTIGEFKKILEAKKE